MGTATVPQLGKPPPREHAEQCRSGSRLAAGIADKSEAPSVCARLLRQVWQRLFGKPVPIVSGQPIEARLLQAGARVYRMATQAPRRKA